MGHGKSQLRSAAAAAAASHAKRRSPAGQAKPLGVYVGLQGLRTTLLVDDDDFKVEETEKRNLVHMPGWGGHQQDDALEHLVALVRTHCSNGCLWLCN
eukprot:scaffold1222_cov330-Prasinococcus_capsulatus_cf.AAC.2